MKEEIEKLKNVQNHMANRLERIIYSLQKEVIERYPFYKWKFTDRPEAAEFINDSLLLSIAELKQVKDILVGLLPVENQLVLPRQVINGSNEVTTPSNSNTNSNSQLKSSQVSLKTSATKSEEEKDPLGAFLLM